MTTPAPPLLSTIPDRYAIAAHRALHTQWTWGSQPLPDSGFGCTECLPDIRVVLAAVWADLPTDLVDLPEAGNRQDLVNRASRVLHQAWPGQRTSPQGGYRCGDCAEDIEVVFDGLAATATGPADH